MRAYQIMTRQVIAIGPETSVVEAADIMLRHHISGLPVVNTAGKLTGIISEGDFICLAEIGTQHKRASGCGFWWPRVRAPLNMCVNGAARSTRS